ncbi:MAG: sulfotransferase domain-containing protein, partial [Parafilimonas sp.]
NNDFTYVEHGFYYEQIKNCLQFFSKQQLLVLDYDDLKNKPHELLKNVFRFLNIDESFTPNLDAKNVTGELKSKYLQQSIIKKSSTKKWIIDHLIDPWLPVNKRKLLKNKMFELNTSKQKQPVADVQVSEETLKKIKARLKEFYLHDTAQLDELLGTGFYSKWFGHEIISKD